jgi:deoxyribodipyrimidine photo-lyase
VSTEHRALLIFTRDLRVSNNPALASAANDADAVIPTFILDEDLLKGACASPNRLSYLLESLEDLDDKLRAKGSALVVRKGSFTEQAMRLAHRWKATTIYMSEDRSPYANRRQERLAQACQEQRIELKVLGGPWCIKPGALTPTGGDHYKVFGPYWRVWKATPIPPAAKAPRSLRSPAGLPATRLPALRSLTNETPASKRTTGGERRARARLSKWLGGPIEHYGTSHDDLPGEATSHLSADLHFGCLSADEVRAKAEGRSEDFVRQLCWRDFHHQVLAARPDLPHADYRPRGDLWRRDKRSSEAWRRGLTGYPIVDAGMRQLIDEGYMHNRARLIVGSFLTKTLYLDWRIGAAHFASRLIDADVANNVGNWQWIAGTGNDTRPNRVLNPLRQAKRFDPDGTYVRRYVGELAAVDGGAVHEPWRLPARERRALGYPAPLVDHRAAAHELRARRSGR